MLPCQGLWGEASNHAPTLGFVLVPGTSAQQVYHRCPELEVTDFDSVFFSHLPVGPPSIFSQKGFTISLVGPRTASHFQPAPRPQPRPQPVAFLVGISRRSGAEAPCRKPWRAPRPGSAWRSTSPGPWSPRSRRVTSRVSRGAWKVKKGRGGKEVGGAGAEKSVGPPKRGDQGHERKKDQTCLI